jgi:hypothetical protein
MIARLMGDMGGSRHSLEITEAGGVKFIAVGELLGLASGCSHMQGRVTLDATSAE